MAARPRSARADYVEAEQRVIQELREQGKPFVILLNSTHPDADETVELAQTLSQQYGTAVQPLDALHMSAQTAMGILETILYEFPIRLLHIRLPGWLSALGREHYLVRRVLEPLEASLDGISKMRDYTAVLEALQEIEGFEAGMLRAGVPGQRPGGDGTSGPRMGYSTPSWGRNAAMRSRMTPI